MVWLDPAITMGLSLSRTASFARSVRVEMAGSSPAMTGLESYPAGLRPITDHEFSFTGVARMSVRPARDSSAMASLWV